MFNDLVAWSPELASWGSWFFTTVIVAIILNLVSSYLKPYVDKLLGLLFESRRKSQEQSLITAYESALSMQNNLAVYIYKLYKLVEMYQVITLMGIFVLVVPVFTHSGTGDKPSFGLLAFWLAFYVVMLWDRRKQQLEIGAYLALQDLASSQQNSATNKDKDSTTE